MHTAHTNNPIVVHVTNKIIHILTDFLLSIRDSNESFGLLKFWTNLDFLLIKNVTLLKKSYKKK
jgi:hypothetical protein